MKKSKYIALIFVAIILTVGCNKSEWKKPTKTTFFFDVNKEKIMNGQLQFTGGQVILREITFDGKRIQGEDVYFEKEFDNGLIVPISSSIITDNLVFDIPQGTYNSIRIDFEAEETDNNLISIIGSYTKNDGFEIPIVLEFEDIGIYDKVAKNPQGDTEIVLVKDNPSKAIIKFDPEFWFDEISNNELEDAETTFINGEESILINENVNEDLHDVIHNIIENKSSQSLHIIFE